MKRKPQPIRDEQEDDLALAPFVAERARLIREYGLIRVSGKKVPDHLGRVRGAWNAKTEMKRRAACYRDHTPEIQEVAVFDLTPNPLPDHLPLLVDEPLETWGRVVKRAKNGKKR